MLRRSTHSIGCDYRYGGLMTIFQKFQNLLGFKEKTLHESSIGRIYQHSKESTIGILSAERRDNKPEVNRAHTAQLENLIRSNGFGFIHLKGYWIENQGKPNEVKVVENSFLIISNKNDNGKLKGFMKSAGSKFNQEAVIYKEAGKNAIIIGTTANGYPGLGKEENIGDLKPNKIGPMYSKMRNHKTFVFESALAPEGLLSRAYRNKHTK